jgi:hypothetical protein
LARGKGTPTSGLQKHWKAAPGDKAGLSKNQAKAREKESSSDTLKTK